MEIEVVVAWLGLSLAIGLLGRMRTIGFWEAFLISLLGSPLIGALFTFNAKRKDTVAFEQSLLKSVSQYGNNVNTNSSQTIDNDEI
jgi:hypothetical protein